MQPLFSQRQDPHGGRFPIGQEDAALQEGPESSAGGDHRQELRAMLAQANQLPQGVLQLLG